MALSSNGENKDPLNPRSMPKRMRRDLKTHDDVRNALRIIARSDFSLRFPTVEEIRQRVGRALWRQEKLELGEHLSHGGEHSVFRALGSIFSSPLVVRVQNPLQPLTSAPLTPDQWRERTRQATRAIMLLPGMNWDKPHPALPFVYQPGEADGVFYTLRDYVKGVPISDTHVRNAIQTRKDVPQAWAFLTVPLQLVAVLIYVREHHRHKRDFSDLHRNLLIGPAQDVHLIDLDDLVQNPDISLARNVSHEIYSVAQLLLGYLLDDSYVRHWNHWDPTQVDVLEKALIAENHFDPQNRQSIEIVARGIAPILRKMLVKPEQGQYTSLEDVFIDLANVGLQIARHDAPHSHNLQELLGILFAEDRRRHPQGTFATIMLKGGDIGGLNPAIKSKIVKRFGKGNFDFFQGSIVHLSLTQALRRWQDPIRYMISGLKGHVPDSDFEFLMQSIDHLNPRDFIRALHQIQRYAYDHATAEVVYLSLARVETMLDYSVRDSNQILLRYQGDTTLPKDVQDYVKGLVGRTIDPEPESLRGDILVPALQPGQILDGIIEEMRNLSGLPEDQIRITLNGIHTPKLDELPLEYQSMAQADLALFSWKALEWLLAEQIPPHHPPTPPTGGSTVNSEGKENLQFGHGMQGRDAGEGLSLRGSLLHPLSQISSWTIRFIPVLFKLWEFLKQIRQQVLPFHPYRDTLRSV